MAWQKDNTRFVTQDIEFMDQIDVKNPPSTAEQEAESAFVRERYAHLKSLCSYCLWCGENIRRCRDTQCTVWSENGPNCKKLQDGNFSEAKWTQLSIAVKNGTEKRIYFETCRKCELGITAEAKKVTFVDFFCEH